MRIGIIGAGHIAGKVSKTLRQMDEVRCYAVAARELWRAAAFAGENGFEKSYGSYEALVRDPEVELVYVATPHSFHYPHVKLALEHGKHVLCEKSFMLNAREAEELTTLARQKGLLLAEAIWTRYMPFSKTIREVVDSGVIGNARMLSANLGYPVDWKERLVKPELGGGALLDLGVYCLNFALMYFGSDIADIRTACVKGESGVDMQETVALIYRDGRIANLHATALCATDRQGVIGGDKGFLVVDNINNPTSATAWDRYGTQLGHWEAPPRISGFEYEFLACRDAIAHGRCEPADMPHSETLKVMHLMDALRAQWGVRFPGESI